MLFLIPATCGKEDTTTLPRPDASRIFPFFMKFPMAIPMRTFQSLENFAAFLQPSTAV